MRCLFLALAKVVDYMHGCFIHIFRVFSLFFVKWWNTLFNLLGHKLPERYLVTPFMKGKEGDEVQSIEPSAATWGRVINPSTSQCQRLPKQTPQKLIVFTILDNWDFYLWLFLVTIYSSHNFWEDNNLWPGQPVWRGAQGAPCHHQHYHGYHCYRQYHQQSQFMSW